MNNSNIIIPHNFFKGNELNGDGIDVSVRRLRDLKGVFSDTPAFEAMNQDTVIYEVKSYLPVKEGTTGGLFFGITYLHPGKVGNEHFMTKGHFHTKRDRAEFYWGLTGHGILLLIDEHGKSRKEKIEPGSLHYIPGYIAHRVINTGNEILSFGACWPSDAGHDYFNTKLRNSPLANAFIAIDLGGSIIKIALLIDGNIKEVRRLDANSTIGLKGNLPRIEQEIYQMIGNNNLSKENICGTGMAFAGLVDPVHNNVLSTNKKYDDACEIDIEEWFCSRFNVPFIMDNDARLATIGEWKRGAAAGYDNLVMMTLGTGVGTGVVIEGKPLYGKHFQAGSLGGHLVIDYKGRPCSCGAKGCIEAHASSFFLADIIRSLDGLSETFRLQADTFDFKHVFSLAAEGNEDALKVRNECLEVWAAGVVSYIHAYDPEIVVIGGGISRSWEVICPFIEKVVAERAWTPWGKVKIAPAKLGDDAALIGLFESFKTKLQ